MLKATSLRAFLTRTVPGLATNPDQLQLFVEKGSVVCRPTATLSYENRYTLQLVLTPFAGDIDALFVPLLAWIAANEPLLLDRSDQGQPPFAYEAEILDDDQVDLSITLDLTERVIVSERGDGGFIAQPFAEPCFPDAFDQVAPATTLLRRLFADDAIVAETADPAWLAANPRP